MIAKLGISNLKTAISVLLCILIIRLLKIDSPFYACIAAVVVIQHTADTAFHTGLYRMVGTLIGAAAGILLSQIAPHNILVITLGIVVVIYITEFLKQKNSTSMACIVFLVIMTNLAKGSPVQYSISRVLETLLGILVAVTVNSLWGASLESNDAEGW